MITIEVNSSGYGFGHTWTLVKKTKTKTRSWYLGQDVKFCRRVLGCDTRAVSEAIGTNDLRGEGARKRLAKFIMEELCLTSKILDNLESWELSAE